MRGVVAAGLAVGLMVGSVSASEEDAAKVDRRMGIALRGIAQSDRYLDTVRIELTGGARPMPSELVVYGTGVGVWNRSRQFEFPPVLVQRAVARLHEAGFASLPQRVIGPSPTPTPTPAPRTGPEATTLLRSISVSVGEIQKTVYQDDKTWPSPEFAALHADLVEIFREAAQTGVEAADLADALAKLEEGVLRPETLNLTVNAPQQRSLASQEGQGWLLRIRYGRIEAQLHELGAGYGPVAARPLSADEAKRIAGWLREAKLTGLPQNLYREGYTDLSVAVLGHEHSVQARAFSGRDPASDAAERKAFDGLRDHLESMCRELHRQ